MGQGGRGVEKATISKNATGADWEHQLTLKRFVGNVWRPMPTRLQFEGVFYAFFVDFMETAPSASEPQAFWKNGHFFFAYFWGTFAPSFSKNGFSFGPQALGILW